MISVKRTPPPLADVAPFAPPPFEGQRLANGLTLRASRFGKRPTAAVSIVFPGAGSAADPEGEEGTADLAAESFLSGTSRLSSRELAETIDDLAAVLDVSAGTDSAVARLFILEKDLDEGLALLAEILSTPSFPEDEVEKTKRRFHDTIVEQRSEPDFLARERLLDRLYPEHPYGRISPSEASLARLSRDSVARFVEERYDLSAATLVLSGAAGPERLLRAAERAFAGARAHPAARGYEPAPPTRITGFSVHLVNRPGSVQTNLLFARPALRRTDADFPAAVVANQALGGGASSRLFSVLREERGLTYGAFSSLSPRRLSGHFGASIDTRTEVTQEAVSGLLDLVRAFAENGPTVEEHERARRFLTGSFVLSRETPGSLVSDEILRLLHGLPEDDIATFRERLAAVTREQATEAARLHFDPSVGVLAAVGDASAIRPILERFGETTLWDADGPLR